MLCNVPLSSFVSAGSDFNLEAIQGVPLFSGEGATKMVLKTFTPEMAQAKARIWP